MENCLQPNGAAYHFGGDSINGTAVFSPGYSQQTGGGQKKNLPLSGGGAGETLMVILTAILLTGGIGWFIKSKSASPGQSFAEKNLNNMKRRKEASELSAEIAASRSQRTQTRLEAQPAIQQLEDINRRRSEQKNRIKALENNIKRNEKNLKKAKEEKAKLDCKDTTTGGSADGAADADGAKKKAELAAKKKAEAEAKEKATKEAEQRKCEELNKIIEELNTNLTEDKESLKNERETIQVLTVEEAKANEAKEAAAKKEAAATAAPAAVDEVQPSAAAEGVDTSSADEAAVDAVTAAEEAALAAEKIVEESEAGPQDPMAPASVSEWITKFDGDLEKVIVKVETVREKVNKFKGMHAVATLRGEEARTLMTLVEKAIAGVGEAKVKIEEKRILITTTPSPQNATLATEEVKGLLLTTKTNLGELKTELTSLKEKIMEHAASGGGSGNVVDLILSEPMVKKIIQNNVAVSGDPNKQYQRVNELLEIIEDVSGSSLSGGGVPIADSIQELLKMVQEKNTVLQKKKCPDLKEIAQRIVNLEGNILGMNELLEEIDKKRILRIYGDDVKQVKQKTFTKSKTAKDLLSSRLSKKKKK